MVNLIAMMVVSYHQARKTMATVIVKIVKTKTAIHVERVQDVHHHQTLRVVQILLVVDKLHKLPPQPLIPLHFHHIHRQQCQPQYQQINQPYHQAYCQHHSF